MANEHRFTVGAYIWDAEVPEAILDIPDFLGLGAYTITAEAETAKNSSIYFIWEHDLPNYPFIKAAINIVEHNGTGELDAFGVEYTINDGQIELNHYDLIFFWPLINIDAIQFDAGFLVRAIDGVTGGSDISANTGTNFNIAPILIPLDTVIPLLYTHTIIPFGNHFSSGVELLWGEWDDQKALDISLYGAYTLDMGLGFNAGYRLLNTDVETNVEGFEEIAAFTRLDFKGFYAGMFYHF